MAGIIDEEFFSGAVFLAETDVELFRPLAIEFTELAVLIPVGVGFFIFVPEELKRNSFSLSLLVKILHRGHLALFWGNQRNGKKKVILQKNVIPFCG